MAYHPVPAADRLPRGMWETRGMVNRDRTRQAPAHDVVVSDLMDLQARLRGDPASSVPADRTLIIDTSGVTVFEGEITVTSRRAALEAEQRMSALLARLDRLESDLSSVMERMDDGDQGIEAGSGEAGMGETGTGEAAEPQPAAAPRAPERPDTDDRAGF
jgi:hypothetical protein